MKLTILLVLLTSILGGCGAGTLSSSTPIDVGNLTKEFKESKEKFKTKYDGKEITISGLVDREPTMISEAIGGAIGPG
ncbi:MAG TPA: hypothetical protein PLP07_06260 [Pyrinomonadaceae bacterium]|nr:hypothetical protein [Chloracidobacterium sp.]MBP9934507.1 hypothetical protein [Pyrinomonadaceae bacterium]MBK7802491.1 hypothetical protein [Chloracidobacterium sp.]MBK9766092.1 hypothetical protein [Chloracidobacterium sp.]MBL0240035.1 hypothetical protein [Chloracidobacterium sp.]